MTKSIDPARMSADEIRAELKLAESQRAECQEALDRAQARVLRGGKTPDPDWARRQREEVKRLGRRMQALQKALGVRARAERGNRANLKAERRRRRGHFATHFLTVAERELDAATFDRLLALAKGEWGRLNTKQGDEV